MLISHARITLPDAEETIAALTELVERHDTQVTNSDDGHVARFRFGTGRWRRQGDVIELVAEAGDAAALNGVKLELGGGLSWICGRDLGLEWTGASAGLTLLPKLAVLTVGCITDITPHMRRIRFTGDRLERFDGMGNLHVKLALPPEDGGEPVWPQLDGNGRLIWPADERRPIIRKYTIRAIDPAAGTVDIDFVRHADAGPGAEFAENARPGQVIGMIGPGGLGAPPADWYLLAGDETALPAIGRILENLDPVAQGVALIEVADADEIQPLRHPPGVELRWLLRAGAEAGTTTLLIDAVRGVPFPEGGSTVFAWAGCEFEAFKAIRRYLRADRKLGKSEHLAVTYWRRGQREEEMETATDRDA